MNRRSFFKGLLAAAGLGVLNRVYPLLEQIPGVAKSSQVQLTLLDWARLHDSTGAVMHTAELLAMHNPILDDLVFESCAEPEHRATIHTPLPPLPGLENYP